MLLMKTTIMRHLWFAYPGLSFRRIVKNYKVSLEVETLTDVIDENNYHEAFMICLSLFII